METIKSKLGTLRVDPMKLILARAFLLFLLTFNLFLSVYILMSLDENNLLIGSLTIIISAIGQFGVITTTFGYGVGSLLTRLFLLANTGLVILSLLLDQFIQNFMTEISFGLSLLSTGVAFLIVVWERKQIHFVVVNQFLEMNEV